VTEIVPAMTEIQGGLHLDRNGKVSQHAYPVRNTWRALCCRVCHEPGKSDLVCEDEVNTICHFRFILARLLAVLGLGWDLVIEEVFSTLTQMRAYPENDVGNGR
jgi:hypothetical protein